MHYPPVTAFSETLPNGLTLILDPDPAAPVVSAQIWVETGSMHEDGLLGSGISHFLEHMVFKGTRDFDGDEMADVVQAAGGHWNAYTSFERTVYHIDGPAESLPVFLRVLTGMVFFPLLPEDEFDTEKEVIRREIDMGLDDPDQFLTQRLLSAAFSADPRRHPVIGHRHLFDRLTHADLTGYHRRRYVTDRCFVVVSGDFDAAATRALVEELTGGCKPGGGPEPIPATDPPQNGPRRVRDTFAVPNSRLGWMWKIPALEHPDTPAFEALASVLGHGRSSLLRHRLRDEAGLALEISSYAWTGPGREGFFGISADCETENRDALVAAVEDLLAGLAGEALDEDLARAKRQIAVAQFGPLYTASGRAADLGSNWHEARDLDFTGRHLEAIAKVEVADLRRVAATLTGGRLTFGVLDPLGTPAPARATKRADARGGIEVRQLGNGATVALIPDRRVPLVRFQAALGAGLPAESPAVSGIGQLLAAVLPKGTRTRPAHEIALTLERLGASMKAGTGNNALLVQAGGLSPDLDVIAGVFAETLCAPALADGVIARERASQLAALADSCVEPLSVAMKTVRRLAFGERGYGLDTLGAPASLESLGREALLAHHARHFTGANLSLALAGDFDAEAVVDALEKALAALPAGARPLPPASHLSAGGDETVRLPKKQAALAIAYPGAGIAGPDRLALAILQEYLSDMAGPLFTHLREERGLAYQVGATQFFGYDTGLFTFYIATDPGRVDEARAGLLEEIAIAAANGIPDDAFEQARATVISGLALQSQSPGALAQNIALDVLYGLPADHHRQLPGLYAALGAAEVREVAARLFSGPPTVATVLPEA